MTCHIEAWELILYVRLSARNDGVGVGDVGVKEELIKVCFYLQAGLYESDENVKYIVECIKEAIVC